MRKKINGVEITEEKICKYCGAKMEVDDVDYNFKGNYDIHWECYKCCSGCISRTRYGKLLRIKES